MILPNQLTVLRIILTPFFVFFFISDFAYTKEISLVIFIIASLTDWYDGWLARKFNYFTVWGKIWDPIADKILTTAAFVCFVILGYVSIWFVIPILIRDILITALRGYAEFIKKPFPTSRYAKWKTFFEMFFLFYILIFMTLSQSSLFSPSIKQYFSYLIDKRILFFFSALVTFITVHSGYLYLKQNFALVKDLFKNEA